MITEHIKVGYLRRLLDEEWPINKQQEQQALLSKIGVEVAEPYRENEKVMEQLNEVLNAIVNGPINSPRRFEGKAEAAMMIYRICAFYEQMFSSEGGCE